MAGYDYGTSGAYYVTVCTHRREPLLVQPPLRSIVENEWLALAHRYPAVTLDLYVIMPDHMHALLWIDASVKHAPTLFTIMKSYKSIITIAWIKHLQQTNQEGERKIWQRYYYDQIIRNEQHLEAVRQYILDNPKKVNTEGLIQDQTNDDQT